jgi:dihydroflavonol-4-reductase
VIRATASLSPENPKTMKRDFILVTGAAGFIGSHITELLSRQGYRVKAFVRHTSNTENLDGLDVEKVFGDMQDRESLEKHCLTSRV